MAIGQIGTWLLTGLLPLLLHLPSGYSDDNPHLYVPVEKFLGLVLPTCPAWQCKDGCGTGLTASSATPRGCQCDTACLLYGDCCYRFFYDCLRYPDEEIEDLLRLSRAEAYRKSSLLQTGLDDQEIRDIVEHQHCSPVEWGFGTDSRYGVFLISICPESWQRNRTRELCQGESDNWFNLIPVANRKHPNRHYRNLHCAVCHGVLMEHIVFWELQLKCTNGTDMAFLRSLRPTDVSERLAYGECSLVSGHDLGSDRGNVRRCWLGPETNSSACAMDDNNGQSADVATWYNMAVQNPNGTEFRNPHHCEVCGQYSATQLECVEPGEPIRNGVTAAWSLLFYHQDSMFRPMLRARREMYEFQEPQCPGDSVYDFFHERCFPLECPPGWYGHKGQCLPYQVSPIPADYTRLPEGQKSLFVKITFTITTDTISCKNIWNQDTLGIILYLLGADPSELLNRFCKVSTDGEAIQRGKERSPIVSSGSGTSQNLTKTIPKTGKQKRDEGKLLGNSDTSSFPNSVGTIAYVGSKGDNVSDQSALAPITPHQGNQISGETHIQILIEVFNFDMTQLQDALVLLRTEMQRGLKSGGDGLRMELLELYTYDTTPSCHHILDVRKDFEIYQQETRVYGYDTVRQEQIPLENIPLKISFEVNADGNIMTSLAAFLCHIPTTTVPLPDCPMKIYDEGDFVLQNGSLYVNSTGVFYERGQFQVSRRMAYVCVPSNVTNTTTPVTVNQGFFSMPYTQYIVVMVCCSVSLACLLATFVTYVCFAQLRDISGIILMCLTASLFVAQLLFAVGIDRTEIQVVCSTIAISLHFLWLSVFAWMNVLTYDIAHKLRLTSEETADKDSKAFKEYCIFAWGVPFLLVGICTALDIAKGSGFEMQYAKDSCWIGSIVASLFGFALPVCLLLLANFTLFACTIYALHAVSRVVPLSDKQKKSRRLLVVYSAMTLILGSGWGLAYLAALTDYQEIWFGFGALCCLQGIFTVCCFVLRARVVQLYKNRFGRNKKTDFPRQEFV